MRRVLLGGLGVALGVIGRPALAQDFPGSSARPNPSTRAATLGVPVRAATLGVPVAVPAAAPPGAVVTPAGLIARGQVTPASVPVSQPIPMPSLPPGAIPLGPPMYVDGPAPAPVVGLPAPRSLNTPSLTEIRGGPVTGGVPPTPVPSTGGAPSGGMTSVFGSGVPTLVPPVGPDDCGTGMPCPEDQFCPAPACPAPRLPMSRLFGLGCADRHWFGAEYLAWWTRSTQLPALVTTSLPADAGILGAATTVPILQGPLGQTLHGGARFSGGWWFSDDQRRGVDARFMFLFRNGTSFAANTDAFPLLARPFFNVNTPVGPFSEVVAAPGLATGGVVVNLQNSLWGADVNYRRFLAGTPAFRLDGLAGFRYLNFKEELGITETFIRTPGSPMDVGVPALAGTITDRFRTENNFYGGQVGLTGEIRRGRWFVDSRASIAFGTVNQSAQISGGQALAFPNGVAQYPGGLLAVPGANIGTFTQNKFAVLPEVGVNLGYHVTPNFRVFVGYNFLYLSSVLRPAGAIDPAVDAARIPNFPLPGSPTPLPGAAHPSPQFRTTDFWAQGISFGMQWTW
jgi:hypothetical protein